MSYQKVWNNDSGDLSTLLPFSIIWVNCNPPFCLWISIFFSTSLFLFFSNQFYTLWKVPPRFAERIVSIPCILCQILASASNETVLCSKQFTNQKERPEKMKLNQTLTPTVRVSCPGPWVNLSLRCITLFWPPGGPNMMLISSSALLYILFSLPPNTQAVTEMRENIWGIIQSYMYGVYRLLAS